MRVRNYLLYLLMMTSLTVVACRRAPSRERIDSARQFITNEIERVNPEEYANRAFAEYTIEAWERVLELLEATNSDADLPAVPYLALLRERNPTKRSFPEHGFHLYWVEAGNAVTGFYFQYDDQPPKDFPVFGPVDEYLKKQAQSTVCRDRFVFLIEQGVKTKSDFPDLIGMDSAEVSTEILARIYDGEPFSIGLLLQDGTRSKATSAKFFKTE